MELIETAKTFFCHAKCMILVSVDGFFQFLPKLVEEKDGKKNGIKHGKTAPWKKLPTLFHHVSYHI